jgi:hypothetical protein
VEQLRGEGADEAIRLSRGAGLLSRFALVTISAIVKLAIVASAHSCLKVPNAFAEPFGHLRYSSRAEQDDYDQRND